jgi:hypothetical protein
VADAVDCGKIQIVKKYADVEFVNWALLLLPAIRNGGVDVCKYVILKHLTKVSPVSKIDSQLFCGTTTVKGFPSISIANVVHCIHSGIDAETLRFLLDHGLNPELVDYCEDTQECIISVLGDYIEISPEIYLCAGISSGNDMLIYSSLTNRAEVTMETVEFAMGFGVSQFIIVCDVFFASKIERGGNKNTVSTCSTILLRKAVEHGLVAIIQYLTDHGGILSQYHD